MMPPSRQDEYAQNLIHSNFGLPVFSPFDFGEKSGRVGDVGFFGADGSYVWLANAFDSKACSNLTKFMIGSAGAKMAIVPDH